MPLYNNILLSRKNEDKRGDYSQEKCSTSLSMKFLQDHLTSKRRLQTNKTQKVIERSQEAKSNQSASDNLLRNYPDNDWGLEEEYDPMVPNSYEIVKADYLRSEKQRLSNLKNAANILNVPRLLDVIDQLDDDDDEGQKSAVKKSRGTAIAPPSSLTSGSNLSVTETAEREDTHQDPKFNDHKKSDRLDSCSVAAKIMSKMGYKLGQGLGRDEQGMSEPLAVEKSGRNVGKILHPITKSAITSQVDDDNQTMRQRDDKMAELLRDSTRVLLLQNMVGPGEVDEELEAETKEECKKYGEVIKCLIYEIPNKKVADDEAVRIFVEFKNVESAVRAASDLNGRYFGGRIVRASFYSIERFNKYELSSLPGS